MLRPFTERLGLSERVRVSNREAWYLTERHDYIVSVLGRDEGYTVKYNPLLFGKGLYLTVYPESSPNTDIVSFLQTLG